MIPTWKIRRELARLGQQMRGVPEAAINPVRQAYHDRFVFPRLECRVGLQAQSDRIAIYLLHQPGGISESTVYTCGFLASKGYSVLVVSNSPVSDRDRARLAPEVWRIVERPNFGYDFGGYRDGIRLLWKWGLSPQTLVILNDSVWFPLTPDTTALEDLESHPADLAGTILRKRGREEFLESYLYRINARLAKLPAFVRYWQTLSITSNKYHVIRRGERGLSRAVREGGGSIGAIYSVDSLPDLLAGDPELLRLSLRHAAYVDADLAAERNRLLSRTGATWTDQAIDHLRRTLAKRQAYSSFPVAMMRLTAFPLMKKSREPVSAEWRRAYWSAVRAGVLPPPASPVAAELAEAQG